MAPLFGRVARTNNSPAGHVEGRFRFLNRAAGVVFDRLRAVLEGWLAPYPQEGKADLMARLRSADDRVFSGAFWELHQAEALRRAGFAITLHPPVPGSTKHPDFLAERGDRSFYLETTVASASNAERAAAQRRGRLYDAVNAVPSPNFWVGVEIEAEVASDPSARLLRRDLGTWLASLDPDALLALADLQTVKDRHAMAWEQAGWRARFWPIPKSIAARSRPGRTIAVYSPEGGMVDTKRPLRQALREKASRYGALDRPYVVAVLIEHLFVDQDDLFDALFGSIAVQVAVGPQGAGPARTVRLRDGSWFGGSGPTGRRVSAVLVAVNLFPWSIARVEPQVLLNPWATRPLAADLGWRTTLADPMNGSIDERPATLTAASVFGLPTDWPGPEDPFPDD